MLQNNYINRELSWIEFNRRVLSEALRKDNPLMERFKFTAITGSNFDEFIRVRIANLIHETELGNKPVCPSGKRPSEILGECLERVKEVENQQHSCLIDELLPELEKKGIFVSDYDNGKEQKPLLEKIYKKEIEPVITIFGSNGDIFDCDLVKNSTIHIFASLDSGEKSRFVIIPIPPNLPRFFTSDDNKIVIPSEAAVFSCLESLFPDEKITGKGLFRILRDADLSIDEKRDESFMKAMENLLDDREQSKPVILQHVNCSEGTEKKLQNIFKLPGERLFKQERLLKLKDLFSLLDINNNKDDFFPPCEPVGSLNFNSKNPPWNILLEKDILLNHPYQSFSPVIQLLKISAEDPSVLAIKMTLYRTSGDSPIINSLKRAARKGKQVTVLVEIKARFDEERNIQWAKELSRAGASVIYGVVNLKVHSKMLLIIRKEREGIKKYVHLGTGNYNSSTAKLYTDFGYMTTREEITNEVASVFNAITGYSDPPGLYFLSMAPFSMKKNLIRMIKREIEKAENGEKAAFMAKLNSLNDPDMVEILYNASRAGVKIDLNVRGICSLVPGVPGLSENIRVISVVGRFLEHSRCFWFLNGGHEEVYLSSADWMPRNLERRIELMFPVLDKDLSEQLKLIFDQTMADNTQSHELRKDGSWKRLSPGNEKALNSQLWFSQFYRKRYQQAVKSDSINLKVRKKAPE